MILIPKAILKAKLVNARFNWELKGGKLYATNGYVMLATGVDFFGNKSFNPEKLKRYLTGVDYIQIPEEDTQPTQIDNPEKLFETKEDFVTFNIDYLINTLTAMKALNKETFVGISYNEKEKRLHLENKNSKAVIMQINR